MSEMTTEDMHSPGPGGTEERETVLEVDDLTVGFPTDDGLVRAVRGVSYRLRRGEALGIVGESGSGKSVTSLAIMGLLPKTARVSGSARVLGQEMVGLDDARISKVRGNKIAMIFQDPLTSLNPVYTVGRQIAEAVRAHHDVSEREARERAVELLGIVGIPFPEQRVRAYPHELSGGMRQRVVIAIAMANDPDVIIADEPTTALDVTVQAQVLEALETARQRTGAALVLITHDLGVIAGHVDRVAVMYAGRMVETGNVDAVFHAPRMPYTLGLLGSVPRMDESRHERLTPILGTPPSLLHLPPGCTFAPRCPMAEEVCRAEEPPLAVAEHGSGEMGGHAVVAPGTEPHRSACHFRDRLREARPDELFRPTAVDAETTEEVQAVAAGEVAEPVAEAGAGAARPEPAGPVDPRAPLLVAEDLVKHFPVRSRGIIRRRVGHIHAVCRVSLELRARETLALVGESGCGKSTTARLLLRLIPATAGEVRYRDRPLTGLKGAQMRPLRRELQIVFQDPFASLDPRMTVFEIIAEPLRIHGLFGGDGAERVRGLLRTVGLNPEHGSRYPHEFSGGQRQRIGVARALALRPKVLVLDEPVSALDVSIQAGVINLLEDLQAELGLSYLFVSHDLSVVRHIADRVAVMYLGTIVETGTTEQLFAAAAHPYTQALISAIPLPDPRKERARRRILVTGDVPSPAAPPSGCRFRTRCPKFAGELSEVERTRCVEEVPELADRGQGHASACHYAQARTLV
ncbi:peptide/nickel transport system ATP-binding protein [Nocardiopsis mwathae]|uniref:Peptide/nickel transport system ATP-binding protein n=2 Tax=Nocardiopsis mwathae TaxID=1472723 RepID=A0A7W9YJX9_9ACTN|nr:peptide/nickel transport system ATP-binding protein [Nocardiopsis mwathae]